MTLHKFQATVLDVSGIAEIARSSDCSTALVVLDAVSWLDRAGEQTWCVGRYLGGEGQPEPSIRK